MTHTTIAEDKRLRLECGWASAVEAAPHLCRFKIEVLADDGAVRTTLACDDVPPRIRGAIPPERLDGLAPAKAVEILALETLSDARVSGSAPELQVTQTPLTYREQTDETGTPDPSSCRHAVATVPMTLAQAAGLELRSWFHVQRRDAGGTQVEDLAIEFIRENPAAAPQQWKVAPAARIWIDSGAWREEFRAREGADAGALAKVLFGAYSNFVELAPCAELVADDLATSPLLERVRSTRIKVLPPSAPPPPVREKSKRSAGTTLERTLEDDTVVRAEITGPNLRLTVGTPGATEVEPHLIVNLSAFGVPPAHFKDAIARAWPKLLSRNLLRQFNAWHDLMQLGTLLSEVRPIAKLNRPLDELKGYADIDLKQRVQWRGNTEHGIEYSELYAFSGLQIGAFQAPRRPHGRMSTLTFVIDDAGNGMVDLRNRLDGHLRFHLRGVDPTDADARLDRLLDLKYALRMLALPSTTTDSWHEHLGLISGSVEHIGIPGPDEHEDRMAYGWVAKLFDAQERHAGSRYETKGAFNRDDSIKKLAKGSYEVILAPPKSPRDFQVGALVDESGVASVLLLRPEPNPLWRWFKRQQSFGVSIPADRRAEFDPAAVFEIIGKDPESPRRGEMERELARKLDELGAAEGRSETLWRRLLARIGWHGR